MHHMFVQVRTKTSIFSQNVTEALVIFPEPPRMFSHLFQKKSNKQKSPSIFTIKIQTTLLTVPPPPFLHTPENFCWACSGLERECHSCHYTKT